MDKNIKKNILEDIYQCLWGYPDSDPEEPHAPTFFFRDNIMMKFGAENWKHYSAALKNLAKIPSLKNNFSKEAITRNFQSLLLQLTSEFEEAVSPKILEQHLDKWFNNFVNQEEIQRSFHFAIENLVIAKAFTIGNVRLAPLDSRGFGRLKRNVRKRVENLKHSPSEIKKLKKVFVEEGLSPFQPSSSSSIAIVKLKVKDQAFGYGLAFNQLNDILSVLRFLANTRLSMFFNFGIRDNFNSGKQFVLVTTKNGFTLNNLGHSIGLKLDAERISVLSTRGLNFFSGLLSKDRNKRSEMEGRILNSAIWIGNSYVERSEKERSLKLCIALEALFSSKSEAPIGSIISERLALLLGKTLTAKKEIYRLGKRIYSVRSQIAHQGSPDREDDLEILLPYAFAFSNAAVDDVGRLARDRGWTKFEEMVDYFEDLKFGPVSP